MSDLRVKQDAARDIDAAVKESARARRDHVEQPLPAAGRINTEALDADLRAAFGEAYGGLSTGKGRVRVLWAGEPAAEDWLQAAALIAAHDPDARTPRQQRAEADAALLAEIEPQVVALDLSKSLPPEDADVLLRWLALRARLGK